MRYKNKLKTLERCETDSGINVKIPSHFRSYVFNEYEQFPEVTGTGVITFYTYWEIE